MMSRTVVRRWTSCHSADYGVSELALDREERGLLAAILAASIITYRSCYP